LHIEIEETGECGKVLWGRSERCVLPLAASPEAAETSGGTTSDTQHCRTVYNLLSCF